MKIQIDIDKETHKELQLYKVKQEKKSLADAVKEILNKFLSTYKNGQ